MALSKGWAAVVERILDDKFGYQSANKIGQNLNALASLRPFFIGGDRDVGLQPVLGALTINARNWIDFTLDGDHLAGFTVQVKVEVRTDDAGTSVTPRIQNITDGTTAIAGSACSATGLDYTGTAQSQTLSFTPAAGAKVYRLQLTGGNQNALIYGIGWLNVYVP